MEKTADFSRHFFTQVYYNFVKQVFSAKMAFAVNMFCEFVSSVGLLSNGPSNFFIFSRIFLQYFLKNIKEFVLSKQFEGNLNGFAVGYNFAQLILKISLGDFFGYF